ncbi:GNAT family N-acetyltransferase [Citreimonas salinaria]|uniref:ElaA protein n=1 Tax=Citreimonas salinaria TaxID=321339 RepID=A0A1H3FM28_9RHOB|nr:GNAT family N-acetyltransferase [Citreimonas salinaria]SDX91184.1 ElaA protein [Citreimonas salinaria]
MSVTIAETTDIDACHALRRTVFIDEQGVSVAEEIDGRDAEAVHLLASVDGVPAGTARILFDGETGKIGRVCVLRPHRGTGLGAALVKAAVEAIRARPDTHIAALGAQLPALGFYERLGFVAYGPVFDDAGIDHRMMKRDLRAS